MSTQVSPINSERVKVQTGNSFRLKLWYIFLLGLIAIGGYAFWIRLDGGLTTTNLTSAMPWGTWVAFYIYFVGMSAGAFLLSSLIHVFDMKHLEKVGRDANLVAIISMLLAFSFITLDMGRLDRFWHVLWYGNLTSVLAYEVRFYLVYMVILFAELYFSIRYDLVLAAKGEGIKAKLAGILKLGYADTSQESIRKDHRLLKILGIIGIPIAIFGVHGGTGTIFAVVKAQPYWNTAIFPVVFVISAMVSGTALVTAIYIIKSWATGKKIELPLVKSLAGWMILFLMIDLGLQFFEIIVGAYGLEEHELATLATIFTSDFSWSYWGVQMGIGALLPIILFFHPKSRNSVPAMLVAAVAVVIGILGVRFNIVVPTLIVPVMHDLPVGYYYPTFVEIATSLGILGIGLIIYTLAVRYLPIDTQNH